MGRLRYFGMNIAFIGMLFFRAELAKATGQNVITSLDANALDTETHNEFIMDVYNNDSCKCIKYDCGCCRHLEWDAVSMDGELCINATYLANDYGISLTVTYNNFAIFNETISARNPPPICFGQDIIDALDAEVCLRIYDIDYKVNKFHACFEISGKIMKLTITKIKLGCIHISNKLKYEQSNLLSLFRKKIEELPNVIMV